MSKKNSAAKNDSFKDIMESINTDPLGSWTGTPKNPSEIPVQDVDDL